MGGSSIYGEGNEVETVVQAFSFDTIKIKLLDLEIGVHERACFLL